jgi:hypothetical protein
VGNSTCQKRDAHAHTNVQNNPSSDHPNPTRSLDQYQSSSARSQHKIKRKNQDKTIPAARTIAFQQSFFPSATQMWNNLPPDVRNISTLEAFKDYLTGETTPMPHLYDGKREAQILRSRIRLKCSDLKEDLARLHLTDYMSCTCGAERESSEHFLFECTLYNINRQQMLDTLPSNITININTLMYGDPSLSNTTNTQIMKSVQKMILSTNRLRKDDG